MTELKIQLTTIHGDADMFVSSKDSRPSVHSFEKRSQFYSLFPDIVTYSTAADHRDSLVDNFYIMVTGPENSRFQISYSSKSSNGTQIVNKLIQGVKSTGHFEIESGKQEVPS